VKIDRFEFTKKFEKSFTKLTTGEQTRVGTSLVKASIDLSDPSLHLHELKGAKTGTMSLNAGGDLRILCRIWDEDTEDEGTKTVALLLIVGTHSQLYG